MRRPTQYPNLFLLQNLIVTHSGKGQTPAALLLVTPASFWYNHLENPTKAVYMPGNGTFKWLPHATCTAQPTATQHSIRRLSPGVRKPYLYAAVGIILFGVLEAGAEQTWWCNESSTHQMKNNPQHLLELDIIIKLVSSTCKLVAITQQIYFFCSHSTWLKKMVWRSHRCVPEPRNDSTIAAHQVPQVTKTSSINFHSSNS